MYINTLGSSQIQILILSIFVLYLMTKSFSLYLPLNTFVTVKLPISRV